MGTLFESNIPIGSAGPSSHTGADPAMWRLHSRGMHDTLATRTNKKTFRKVFIVELILTCSKPEDSQSCLCPHPDALETSGEMLMDDPLESFIHRKDYKPGGSKYPSFSSILFSDPLDKCYKLSPNMT